MCPACGNPGAHSGWAVRISAQTTSATFGTVFSLGGTPSDIVLDESRGKLYLVNSNANRVDVYDYNNNQKLGPITVGPPASGCRYFDGQYVFVRHE